MSSPVTKALEVAVEIGKEYGKISGRTYGLYEGYKLDDAEYVIVLLGSTAGTAKTVVDDLRAKGVKAGILKIRLFRPFAYDQIASVLEGRKAVAVMDRSDGLAGMGGPLFGEIRSALYESTNRPPLVDYVYGLGGRDCGPALIHQVYADLQKIGAGGGIANRVTYLGVRE